MKKRIILEAMFEIFLVISLIFIFSLSNASNVYAEEDKRVCCQKAVVDGETRYCEYTEEKNCDSGGMVFDNKCEDVSICRPVCCNVNSLGYEASGGEGCYKNVGADYCRNFLKGEVISDASCNVPECQKGCCKIGSQCGTMTEDSCRDLTNQYPDLELDYKAEINNEIECSNVCRAEKKGCCVIDGKPNNCKLTSFSECLGGDFYDETDCVDIPEKCNHCADKTYKKTGCALEFTTGEDVYYYDKCDNPILFKDKPKDFDCDYAKGTLCREDKDKKTAECFSLNCPGEKLWDNKRVDENLDGNFDNDKSNFNGRKERINGESWCEYDADAGPTRDLPGTRHYVHTCYEGEEVVDECKDFREEYCLQFDGLDMDVAKCLPNRAVEKPCGACAEDSNPKECCENTDLRDCVWISANKEKVAEDTKKIEENAEKKASEEKGENVDLPSAREVDENKDGVCVPLVPPGIRFWEEDNSLCNYGSKTGDKALKAYWSNIGWGADWDCDAGCELYTQKFAYGQNVLCRAQGDCGADYNLAGKWSGKGFVRSCEVSSQIKDDYDEGDAEEVSDYGIYYGDDHVEELIKNCLEELPDPAGKTGNDKYFFEEFINYKNNLFVKLPPGAEELSFWRDRGLWTTTIPVALLGTAVAIALGVAVAIAIQAGSWIVLANLVEIAAVIPVWGWVVAAALVIAAAISFATSDSDSQTVDINCKSWQPPTKSVNCHLCNEKGKISYLDESGNPTTKDIDLTAEGKHECTEYLCKSLGQGCEFFPDTEEGPKCLGLCESKDGGKPDVLSPSIKVLKDLSELNVGKCRVHSSPVSGDEKDCVSENAKEGQSGGYDVKFVKENTDVTIGVETTELATCRWDWEAKGKYEELEKSFDQASAAMRHTITLEAGKDLMPKDKKRMYVRCMDICENDNKAFFTINLEVSDMIDLGAPAFNGIEPIDGSPVKYDTDKITAKLKLNEGATCRWSRTNDPYDTMQHEFNCRASYLKGCDFILDGLNVSANAFFIRCQDKDGNINKDAIPNNNGYNLIRSSPLNITSVSCINSFGNECGVIYDKNFTLEINTIGGGFNGKAICFARSSNGLEYEFFETDSSIHRQVIGPRITGDYTEKIRCRDDVGNEILREVSFKMVSDEVAPKILKISSEAGKINILTDEPSSCKYADNSSFIYDEMNQFETTGDLSHSTSVNEKNYVYVKCVDRFNHVVNADVYLSES